MTPAVFIGDTTFGSGARAVRHVVKTRGNYRLNKGQTFVEE